MYDIIRIVVHTYIWLSDFLLADKCDLGLSKYFYSRLIVFDQIAIRWHGYVSYCMLYATFHCITQILGCAACTLEEIYEIWYLLTCARFSVCFVYSSTLQRTDNWFTCETRYLLQTDPVENVATTTTCALERSGCVIADSVTTKKVSWNTISVFIVGGLSDTRLKKKGEDFETELVFYDPNQFVCMVANPT